jgi:4-aminobutyrate aminotransferase-like enzyme
MQRFVNLKRSKGNIFVDIYGNRILDLHCNFISVPLGYNNDALVNAEPQTSKIIFWITELM